jgi:uncharacterized protein (DUF2236 family)
LFWVLATLYEASVFATDRLIDPMPVLERTRFYEEMRLLEQLIGIPCENMPGWESMLATGLEAGPAARELMAFLMSSSLSRLSKWTQVAPVTQLDDAWIRMSIPHDWAVALGLRPTGRDRRSFARATRLLRFAHHAIPAAATRIPAHHQATLRLARSSGRGGPPIARAMDWVNRRRRLPMSLKPVEPLTGAAAEVARDLMQTASAPPSRT